MNESGVELHPIRRIVVVLNPKAGRGQGAKRRAELERLMADASAKANKADSVSIAWEIRETQTHGDGTRLAREAIADGADLVAAMGGDGTLSEVVNGIVGSGARLGLLPLGTGNDFARAVGLSPNASIKASGFCMEPAPILPPLAPHLSPFGPRRSV